MNLKRNFIAILSILALTAAAQTDRVTRLQGSRDIVITEKSGTQWRLQASPNKSVVFHKNGSKLTVNSNTIDMDEIGNIRMQIPKKFALNEDSTTFTPQLVDNGLLALRRSFLLNGWNTIVLPFSLTGYSVLDVFGEGTLLAACEGITAGDEARVDFVLQDLNSDNIVLKAGVNYLIKPTREPDILVGQTTSMNYGSSRIPGPAYLIYGVTVNSDKNNVSSQTVYDNDGNVGLSYRGTYNMLTDNKRVFYRNRTVYSLNDEGRFYETTDSIEMKGFRNWFVWLKNTNNLPIRFYVNGVDEDLTLAGIEGMSQDAQQSSRFVFDIQGRRVDTPRKRGIYIINGKKIIVK